MGHYDDLLDATAILRAVVHGDTQAATDLIDQLPMGRVPGVLLAQTYQVQKLAHWYADHTGTTLENVLEVVGRLIAESPDDLRAP